MSQDGRFFPVAIRQDGGRDDGEEKQGGDPERGFDDGVIEEGCDQSIVDSKQGRLTGWEAEDEVEPME